jgi:hypothetical protein
MVKFQEPKAKESGWTTWQCPVMRGYKLACCDCGLVHGMDFRIGRVVKRYKDGRIKIEFLSKKKYRVEFRVCRDEKCTDEMRRKMRRKLRRKKKE